MGIRLIFQTHLTEIHTAGNFNLFIMCDLLSAYTLISFLSSLLITDLPSLGHNRELVRWLVNQKTRV